MTTKLGTKLALTTALSISLSLSAHARHADLSEITPAPRQSISAENKDNEPNLTTSQNQLKTDYKQTTQDKQQIAPETYFEPLIVNNNGTLTVTDTFKKNTEANVLADHYVYCLTKGNVQLSDIAYTELNKMGWEQVGMFSALEGKHLNFGTIAGVILYNKLQNMYNVVWHGTASNAEGWETNLDNELIETSQIANNVVDTIREEIITLLRDTKSLRHFFGGTNRQLNDLMNFVKKNLTSNLRAGKLDAFKDNFMKMIAANLPKIASKSAESKNKSRAEEVLGFNKDTSLLEKIDAIFKVKQEMLNAITTGGCGLNYEGKTHRGFTLKTASAMPEILQRIEAHAKTLSQTQKAQARLMTAGHSQAGSLAKIFAASVRNNFKTLFGKEITADQNRLLVHAISAAPAGDHTFRSDIEDGVGLGNIFDQKCDRDFVPVSDLASHVPDVAKKLVQKIPVIGKQLTSKVEAEYASQIGTPAVDTIADVDARLQKHFPGKTPSWITPVKRLVHNNLALPHYGVNLGDSQPAGENYGRTEHFEKDLALPLVADGADKMEAYGQGFEKMLAQGQASLDTRDLSGYVAKSDLEKKKQQKPVAMQHSVTCSPAA